MTAQTETPTALAPPGCDPVERARELIESRTLTVGAGRVGLELELHLVDLRDPGRRPSWARVESLLAGLPRLPGGSSVTVEPGGQVELSTRPAAGVVAAVADLRADCAVLRSHARGLGLGLSGLGADPARPAARVNPGARYVAMEQHFDATGQGRWGRAMMTATAALQVNVDGGPVDRQVERWRLLGALVPVLVAASATSSHLCGDASGWASMRQQAWEGIDPRRRGELPQGEAGRCWADYALRAPVMLVRDGDAAVRAVTGGPSFEDWLRRPGLLGRAAAVEDLDHHLTTLFPPVRPRGYLEVRCLDALPDRWWPAFAALLVTLLDDAVAADRASELCEVVHAAGVDAATAGRLGLRAPTLASAAAGCAEVVARRCPDGLRHEVEELAELLAAGRTPGDELRERARAHGPLRLLEEEACA